MQTLVFTRAVTEIVKELKIRELNSLLQSWLVGPLPISNAGATQQESQQLAFGAEKDKFASLLFDSHAGYDRLSRLGPTQKILEKMDMSELYEPTRLARMMTFVSGMAQVHQVRQNTSDLFNFFQTVRAFLKLEKTTKSLLEDEKIGEVPPNDKILEVQLTDYDGRGVEPERLGAALNELAKLQMNIARLLRANDDRLTVKYLDSGSDIKIGLEGAKDVIDGMRDLLLQFWDKIRFRSQDTFEKDIEALSKGLEFLAKTKEAVDNKSITQEEADNLKARVFRGVNNLVGLGVTLPLTGQTAPDERKQLMEKRSTRLLTSGGGTQAEPLDGE